MKKEYTCHKISEGKGVGEILLSTDDFCFYLVDPKTGIVIEKNHCLEGQSIAGKVLVFPNGKGSSVVQVDGFYQLAVKKTLPVAIVVRETEPVLVSSAVVVGEPMVDRVEADPFEIIRDGDWVRVDGEAQEILVRRPRA